MSDRQDVLLLSALSKNPNTPAEILFELGAEFPQQLLDNPVFSLLPLEYPNLAEAIPEKTLRRLLRCDRVPRFLLEQALLKDNSFLRLIAGSRSTPVDVLERLSNYQGFDVRASVASNPKTPIYLLDKLGQDPHKMVLGALAANPNMPINLLEQLVERRSLFYVRQEVRRILHAPTPPTDAELRQLRSLISEGFRLDNTKFILPHRHPQ
ncbi:MAG: hypothetical protein SW833_13610 [Cyanobacteriota bacterium]|nr:hypothetical protein [Cyanobacteriota bacterium]